MSIEWNCSLKIQQTSIQVLRGFRSSRIGLKMQTVLENWDHRENGTISMTRLITFYTFAPLVMREDRRKVVQDVLGLCSLNEHVKLHKATSETS
jgi:hypothetical protein